MREKDLVLKLAAIIGDEITHQITPDDSEYIMFTSKYNLLYEIDRSQVYMGNSLIFSITDVAFDPIVYKRGTTHSIPWTYTCNKEKHQMISILMHMCKRPDLVGLALLVLKSADELFMAMHDAEMDSIIQIRTRSKQ